jgi:hypothetical protein
LERLIFERHQTVAPGRCGIADQLVNHRVGRVGLVQDHVPQAAGGSHQYVHGRADHYGSASAAQNDDGRGDLRDVLELAAFHDQAAHDSAEG